MSNTRKRVAKIRSASVTSRIKKWTEISFLSLYMVIYDSEAVALSAPPPHPSTTQSLSTGVMSSPS